MLAQVLVAASGAGVIGSGAESGPATVDAAACDVLQARIREATDAGDATVLTILALLAEDMGWTDLAADAADALEEVGP